MDHSHSIVKYYTDRKVDILRHDDAEFYSLSKFFKIQKKSKKDWKMCLET